MKSEAISWFRIQEMFRFQSFHMFGILGCAVVTAGIALRLLQRLRRAEPRRSGHRSRTQDDGQRRAVRDWRHVLRTGLGADRRLSRTAVHAAGRRRRRDERRDPRGAGRHMDLRDAARQIARPPQESGVRERGESAQFVNRQSVNLSICNSGLTSPGRAPSPNRTPVGTRARTWSTRSRPPCRRAAAPATRPGRSDTSPARG